ncbi:hypothetical protein DYBT9275_05607 [Dyadobacter sp. CECT 9275]|uniref:Methyltransferase type 11 domain-containing protein n=1 Tax=Dyadobacter helix TaxID=2822344 RepID=A0A916JI61_9BACT|nr:class I SAM-dependent methyltransferase [Dyadobacter sp. CECT 9275]CAG5016680.1 hypothetical protein DYBT9275_05607 [Dyadobacter sp. CECT 9275]
MINILSVVTPLAGKHEYRMMQKEWTESDLKEVARQLSNPEGDAGVKTGALMQVNNANMIQSTIMCLNMDDGDTVLEIGPGNAAHLKFLLSQADGLIYTGADISATMVQEAQWLNQDHILAGEASFRLTDGVTLPFPDHSFDKVFTVNTLYFWAEPLIYAKEIYRILKSGGLFGLTFADQDFMKDLPFTKYGFQLYSQEMAVGLLEKAGFEIESIIQQNENITGNQGMKVSRDFMIVLAGK